MDLSTGLCGSARCRFDILGPAPARAIEESAFDLA
jgi:hypothetical protein